MELNLPEIFERLSQGGSTQEEIATWKSILYKVVSPILGQDLHQINAGSDLSLYEVCLEFLTHTIAMKPQVFVSPPATDISQGTTPGLSQVKSSEQGNDAEEGYGLTCWLVGHVVELLSISATTPLHSRACDVLTSLLQAVRLRNPHYFHRLITELVYTLRDLADFDEKFYGDEADNLNYVAVLERFDPGQVSIQMGETGQTDLAARRVNITDPGSNQQLQINISCVLTRIALDMSMFGGCNETYSYTNVHCLLWNTLGRQIEFGEAALKTVTYQLCARLIKFSGLPASVSLDYLLDCLVATLELLRTDTHLPCSEVKGVEKEYFILLHTVLASADYSNIPPTSRYSIHHTLLEGYSQLITSHIPLTSVSSDTSLEICQVLTEILKQRHSNGGDSLLGTVNQLLVPLVGDLGVTRKPHYGVGLLREIVALDLNHHKHSKSQDVAGKHDRPGAASPVVGTLSVRLNGLLEELCATLDNKSLDHEKVVALLEGLHVVLDVMCWGAASSPSYVSGGRLMEAGIMEGICAAWRSSLKLISTMTLQQSEPGDLIQAGYAAVVQAIGALVFIQDKAGWTSEILQQFTWMVSMPWLPREMSWQDLKLTDKKEAAQLSSKMADIIGEDITAQCAFILCLLPKEVACKWRGLVMKMALGDSVSGVKTAAISGFPFFLHHAGPNANHLVYDALHSTIDTLSDGSPHQVATALARTVGPMACVISRHTAVARDLSRNIDWSYQSATIQCSVCGDSDESSSRPKIVDPNMFLPFMDLLQHKDPGTKLEMVGSLKRLFCHLGSHSGNSATIRLLSAAMTLMQDSNYSVRTAFSKTVRYCMGERIISSVSRSEIDNVVVSRLNEAAKVAKTSADNTFIETVLHTVGQVARVLDDNLILVSIIILLDSLCTPSSSLAAAVALGQFKLFAEEKKVNMRHLFLRFGRRITQILVEHVHDSQRKKKERDPLAIIHDVAGVFQFDDAKSFFQRTERLILPHLVRKATPTASTLIKLIAKQVGDPNHKGPLARNIRHIFCYLVCSCQPQELLKALNYLETESEWNLGTLLRQGENVDSELLLHLSTHYEQVMTGLKIWSSNLAITSNCNEDMTDSMMAEILQPKLLGILVHVDNHLNSAASVEEKLEAYDSVICLMKLMGSHDISQVRMRVMTTLRIGLKFKEKGFPELCCRAWHCFVHIVELPALGPMLSQISVCLLSLLPLLPKQTADIFNFLIVDNRAALNQHFHELFFLPDSPELSDVNSVLAMYTVGRKGQCNVKTKLEQLVRGISHESLEVRHLALNKLKTLLHNNQAALYELVMASEAMDMVISDMVSSLLQGCRESDLSSRYLYGECLGKLGAIDPGRLDVVQTSLKVDLTKFQASVNENNFAFDLIIELGKAFLRAKDRNTQDCVAFAIQQLIQQYHITDESDSNSPGAKLWRRFPEEVQEIMAPLRTSRYMLTVGSDWSQLVRPIYRSKKGSLFPNWVRTLSAYLSTKVVEEGARSVFEACRGVIKNDHQVALYLLPYIVVHALLDGTDTDHHEMNQEILEVLQHAQEPESHHHQGNSSATVAMETYGKQQPQQPTSDLCHMSAQTVFSLLDHLKKWTQHRMMVLSAVSSGRSNRAAYSESKYSNDHGYQKIQGFLERIPQDALAYASFNCGAYTRSLMHFEHHIRSTSKDTQSQTHLDFLQKLYMSLEEPDGVSGVTALRLTRPSLTEQILAFESTGHLSDASVCYDQAIQGDLGNLSLRQGLLGCRLALGELNSTLDLCNGMLATRPDWERTLNAYRVEAAWKLGSWDNLQTYLRQESHGSNWNVGLGKLLLAVKYKDEDKFSSQLKLLRGEMMGPLSAASMEAGSYHRGYQFIVRLHMLNEVEQGAGTLLSFPRCGEDAEMGNPHVKVPSLLRNWQNRLQFTQSSYRTQEAILNLQRVMLDLGRIEKGLNVKEEVGRCWLRSAQIARESALIQTAHSSLLSASEYNLPEFCMEKAKWLWERGDHDHARSCLEKALEEHYPDRSKLKVKESETPDEQMRRMACAKVLLQLVRYCEETSSCESNTLVLLFKEVKELHPKWEDGYFYTARYYDKLMTTLFEGDRPEKQGQFVIQVVQNFGNSLVHGNQFIYQSMPRMLTLWLDFGSEVIEGSSQSKAETVRQSMRAILSQLNRHMEAFQSKLAPYQFLTAFPQLISRICHTHPDVFTQLSGIMASLLVAFPQQAVWMMMAVSKSTYSMRMKRCQEIFSMAKSKNSSLNKFLQDATKLSDRLLDLCNRSVAGNAYTLSMSQHFKPLQRLVEDRNFSEIIIPRQSHMVPSLPTVAGVTGSHDPFPTSAVFISSIEDTIEVLPSLQKPKKVTFRGNDGNLYIVLCKPKDDLRKDARLMEFSSIINKCLRKDPESRRRNLHIRTFTVTPLNEECGLLEWVPNTSGLRHILLKLYRERGIYTSSEQLKSMQLPVNETTERKLQIYRNKLLPRHPALFSQWFLRNFPDPTSWYNARLAYCRTTAVMSIAGYILGLGDRHGENILIDSTNGDCVHVDFNCLFSKGELFDYPEIVPFRLTHNMVDAMGPLGYEGIFTRSCEVTMRVMRDQMDPLMSVLKTFIYDPLVEWSKPAKGRTHATESGEIRNEKAQTHVKNIEAKLKGLLKTKTKGLPLSVEGHCKHLILEATNESNLARMYIGWAAYM